MLIARVAEGRDQPLTVLTTCDMAPMRPQTRLGAYIMAFCRKRIGLRKNPKNTQEAPCNASDETFFERHWTIS